MRFVRSELRLACGLRVPTALTVSDPSLLEESWYSNIERPLVDVVVSMLADTLSFFFL